MPLYRIFALLVLAAAGAAACFQSKATDAHRAEFAAIAPATSENVRSISDGTKSSSARMVFSDEIGFALLAEIPTDRRVILKSIGDDGDQLVASAVQRFLRDNGYDVIRIISNAGSDRTLRRIEFSVDTYDNVLTIAPSARSLGG